MNHIYGSPFPTINPKIRYRTALERAGFDVNFGEEQGAVNQKRPVMNGSWGAGPPRVSSAGEVRSQRSAPTESKPMFGYQYPVVQSNKSSGSFAPNNENMIPSRPFTQQSQAGSGSSLRSMTPSKPINSEKELNPIEKSFMMLTQNDVSSNSDSTSHSARTPTETVRESIGNSVKRDTMSSHPQMTDVATVRDTVFSAVESLNFEPSSELHAGLSSPQPEENGEHLKRGSSLPALTVTTHFNDMSEKPREAPATKGEVDCQNSEWSQGNQQYTENQRFSRVFEEVETPQTATNLQVKELLAQLDDVSYTKNAQLDNSILAATAANSSVGSQLDIRSLSVDRSRSCSNTSSRFKKSSAYLSQFPGGNLDNAAQSLTHDDESLSSFRAEDSPVFYNFERSQNDGFSAPQEPPRIVIEPLQLSHKESIENSKELKQPQSLQGQRPDAVNLNKLPFTTEADASAMERSIHKYPPGSGPCRACGEEVNSKRIFSKGENELSGQWHRECFRCLTCNVKFNKRIPCYILNDLPYCQQHYHENNGSICQVCQGFIEGECLENDRTERFHVHCLICFLCKSRIMNDYFIYNEELPLCSDHDIEALLRDGLAEGTQSGCQDNTVSKRRTRLITLGQT